MDQTDHYICSLCGQASSTPEHWFLILQGSGPDKLTVLKWNSNLAAAEGIQVACCAAHVRELVVHWMATGNVDHPFARSVARQGPQRRWTDHEAPWREIDLRDGILLGDLTMDRESVRRVLSHNPSALRAVLDSLQSALENDIQQNLATAPCSSSLVI